ncbi:DUF5682 family protein [Streptomyces tanashiensis]|uniref:DUF5682 family protein n=2 Tax=Streptomyces tanashiensis TaxID=67367 RepID=UPI0019942D24|nr:DUF5682 family protein [Streptomyces tanashiensis]GGY05593.1 hypothetical protein GCM10010299_06080 [Streptomyces tanashiensis]
MTPTPTATERDASRAPDDGWVPGPERDRVPDVGAERTEPERAGGERTEPERAGGFGAGGAGGRVGHLLLGVRHHGPGSARGVRAALEAARPAAVLVEGPAEADALVALAADPGMRPPVALLAHAVDDPGRAAFWPMAEFSPEWVAIRWALERGVPVRFFDLPAAHTLAAADPTWSDEGDEDEVSGGGLRIDPVAELARAGGYEDAERWWEDVVELRGAGDPTAPFEALAEAMGALRETYGHGGHPRDLVREAHMRLRLRAARKEFGDSVAVVCGAWHVPALTRRTTVAADKALLKGLPRAKTELTWVPWTHRRLARRSGYGAGIDAPGWYGHLFAAPDRPVERWMTKVAGLLRAEDHPVSSAHVIEAVRLAETLAALRGRPLPGLDETTDAVRAVLCEGSDVPLGLVRDRLVVGDVLGEVPAAAPAVPLQRDLTRRQRTLRLKPEAQEREVGLDLRKETDGERSRLLHRLRLLGVHWGEPAAGRAGTGTFRETWRLRWEPELHVQVAEAGVWGTTVEGAATAKAESLALAATALADVTALAEQCLLAGLTDALPVVMRALADRAALDTDVAHLAQALPALARSLRYGDVRGTGTAALGEVAAGLAERICVGLPPACAGLDADAAAQMRDRLDAVHTAIGLLHEDRFDTPAAPDMPGSPAAPDRSDTHAAPDRSGSHAAPDMPGSPAGPDRPEPHAGPGRSADGAQAGPGRSDDGTQAGPRRSDDGADSGPGRSDSGADAGPALPLAAGLGGRWSGVLRRLAGWDRIPGGLRGRAARLLLDEGRLGESEAALLMSRALSPGTPPADAAAWIDGFVGGASGGGLLLVHDERLLDLVDAWLTGVPDEAFTDVLPLLRRTFSAYEPGVRRTLGELVARGPRWDGPGPSAPGVPGFAPAPDPARADAVLPLLHLILGTEVTA